MLSALENLIDRTDSAVAAPRRELALTGLSGYLAGTVAFFSFGLMSSLLPPGFFSFFAVLAGVLLCNFLLAAVSHLFLDMTGSGGDAVRLFLLQGASEFLTTLLLPLGFLSRAGHIGTGTALLAAFCCVLAARISFIRRLYSVSRNKALLAFAMPYLVAWTGFMLAFVYGVVWLVWAVS